MAEVEEDVVVAEEEVVDQMDEPKEETTTEVEMGPEEPEEEISGDAIPTEGSPSETEKVAVEVPIEEDEVLPVEEVVVEENESTTPLVEEAEKIEPLAEESTESVAENKKESLVEAVPEAPPEEFQVEPPEETTVDVTAEAVAEEERTEDEITELIEDETSRLEDQKAPEEASEEVGKALEDTSEEQEKILEDLNEKGGKAPEDAAVSVEEVLATDETQVEFSEEAFQPVSEETPIIQALEEAVSIPNEEFAGITDAEVTESSKEDIVAAIVDETTAVVEQGRGTLMEEVTEVVEAIPVENEVLSPAQSEPIEVASAEPQTEGVKEATPPPEEIPATSEAIIETTSPQTQTAAEKEKSTEPEPEPELSEVKPVEIPVEFDVPAESTNEQKEPVKEAQSESTQQRPHQQLSPSTEHQAAPRSVPRSTPAEYNTVPSHKETGPPPRHPSFTTFNSWAPANLSANDYVPYSNRVISPAAKYRNEYTSGYNYQRPTNTYLHEFDNYLKIGAFSQNLWTTERYLERDRARARQRQSASRTDRSRSGTRATGVQPRPRDYSVPAGLIEQRPPSRMSSFNNFIDYSRQKDVELNRSASQSRIDLIGLQKTR